MAISTRPPDSQRRSRLDGLLFAAVAAILVYCYWTYAALRLTRPSRDDYAESTSYIRSRFEPGDLIDVNPFYPTRVRQILGDLPMASFRRPAEEDLGRYRRLWLFSLFGAERRAEIGLDARYELLEDERFGRIDVRLYRLPEPRPLVYDFRAELERASVWIDEPMGRRHCSSWQQGRWRCSAAYWNYVGREILEIGEEPRAVIWAHPVPSGTLTIHYPDVPLGSALDLATGFDSAALRYGGSPVTLAVEIDGREVRRLEQRPVPGFFRLRIETREFRGAGHAVTFKVTTPNERWRHFCFAAEARG
jgi:hypothetical protein